MIQGILIQAHKNFEQLLHLVEYFTNDCYVFIHIDKKSTFKDEQISLLKELPQVKGIYKKFSVHWAGFSILKCELFLLKEALKYPEIGYFHLISGQDYPIKPLNSFLDFFNANNNKSYMEFQHIPFPQWEKNTYARYCSYFLFDYLPRTEKARKMHLKFQSWQRKIGIKRNIPNQFDHLYGGSAWFSITREAVSVLLNYHKHHKSFYHRLRFTFCPEETYVTTVLVNLIPKNKVIADNYRYIRWTKENGSCPANYGTEHFFLIAQHHGFFARKFDVPVSQNCISLIDKYLLSDSPLEVTETGGWVYNGFLKYHFNYLLNNLLLEYFHRTHTTSIIDFGCGAGYYVASFRRNGFLACGYDANPYTPELSSLILPPNDCFCETADLTGEIEVEEKFDVALCLDVIGYIPIGLWEKAINNLIKLSQKAIIIGLKHNSVKADASASDVGIIKNHMSKHDFHYNESLSQVCFSSLHSYKMLIFERILN